MIHFPAAQPASAVSAEQGVLGRLLLSQQGVHQVQDLLREEYFAGAGHRAIWVTLMRRAEAGQPADLVTVRTDLEATGQLEAAGGAGYLAQLAAADCGAILLKAYATLIREAWVARRVVELADEARAVACGGAEEGSVPAGRQAVEGLEAGLLALAEHLEDEAPAVPLGEAVQRALDKGHDAMERGTAFNGISAGYAALDRMLCGMAGGDLILLAARPSMGKTGLGMGIAVRAAARLRDEARQSELDGQEPVSPHRRVLFWSGEMGADQLGARVAAAHAGLPVASVYTFRQIPLPIDRPDHRPPPMLGQADIDRLVGAQHEAAQVGVVIDDRAGITVAKLRHRARRMRRQVKAGGLAAVVVDYVSLMSASAEVARQGNPVTAVSEISRGLKALARELDVPVLALSQLNRAVESRENKMPQLSDLRDSGSLEQDADKVLFLYRPHYYLSRAVPTQGDKENAEQFGQRRETWLAAVQAAEGKALIGVAKNRQGPTGTTELRFHDRSVWFRDEGEYAAAPAWPSFHSSRQGA